MWIVRCMITACSCLMNSSWVSLLCLNDLSDFSGFISDLSDFLSFVILISDLRLISSSEMASPANAVILHFVVSDSVTSICDVVDA